MKVILGCDPLLTSLTGIGNYTQQLAIGLQKNEQIRSLDLFAHGTFFGTELINKSSEISNVEESSFSLLSSVRSVLAMNQFATLTYSKVIPIVEKIKLRKYSDYLYHSPNFVLPNFSGRKVVTIHDLSTILYPQYHPKSRTSFVNKAIENSVLHADHVITDTEFIRAQLINYFGINENRVTSVPLAASDDYRAYTSTECEKTLNELSLSYRHFFLFVSTIEPRKNLNNLLDAMEKYSAKNYSFLPLVIVGGKGWNSEEIHNKIDRLQRKGVVKYLGYIPKPSLVKLFSAAKALIFISHYEGFGLPVLEALQSGTPVITSKDSAMSEVVAGNGVFVEPENVEDIEGAITFFASENEAFEGMRLSGMAHAKSFSWVKCAQETINVYRNTLLR